MLSPAFSDFVEVLGASTSWGSVGVSGPVIGYAYLSLYIFICVTRGPSLFTKIAFCDILENIPGSPQCYDDKCTKLNKLYVPPHAET